LILISLISEIENLFLGLFISFLILIVLIIRNYNFLSVGIIGGFDFIRILFIILSLWITLIIIISIIHKINLWKRIFFYYSIIIIFLLTLCFCIFNIIWFYIFFERILIPIVLIIYGWGEQPERLQAGLYIILYTVGASLPLLIFFLWLNLRNSLCYITFIFINLDLSIFGVLFLVLGFLVKLPIFLFHLWLPKAHVEAPVAGSIILAGVLLKLGGYGLIRVYSLILINVKFLIYIFISISLLGFVLMGLLTLCQVDIKLLIAYSSVCHIGLVNLGIFSGYYWGAYGSLLIILGHGLCSSALFCIGNIIYERFYTRRMMLWKGLIWGFPTFIFWWFIFCVINIGFPPFINFLGEIILICRGLSWRVFTFLLIIIGSFIGASFSLYIFSYTHHGNFIYEWANFVIYEREFLILFFHLYPLILYIIKCDLFTLLL